MARASLAPVRRLTPAACDRQRSDCGGGVHVVFDDGPEWDAEVVELGEQAGHVGLAVLGSTMAPAWTAVAKDMPCSADLGQDLRVDRLQVDVADAVRVLGNDGVVVAAGAGDVAGIQAQGDGGGVGELEEPGDAVLAGDVCVGVRWNIWATPVSSNMALPSCECAAPRVTHWSGVRSAGSRSAPV